MKAWRSHWLFDLAAPLVFYGVFAHDMDLKHHAKNEYERLQTYGYRDLGRANQTLDVWPMASDAEAKLPLHGGLYQSGRIYLRREPKGADKPPQYLSHELAHALSAMTCQHRALWQEEAFALSFSNQVAMTSEAPSDAELGLLRRQIFHAAPLTQRSTATLRRLLAIYPWPLDACARNEALVELLEPRSDSLSMRVIAYASGRPLVVIGDQSERLPLGSLMKLPLVAALGSWSKGESLVLAKGLLRSDKEVFRGISFDRSLYAELIGSDIDVSALPFEFFVGERNFDRGFAYTAHLEDAAFLVRASHLTAPSRFGVLLDNGHTPSSTLGMLSASERGFLKAHRIETKTGTVATADGEPLWGYLAMVWPANRPAYVAVFRKKGVAGKSLFADALRALKKADAKTLISEPNVEVRILSRLPSHAFRLSGGRGATPAGAVAARGNQRAPRYLTGEFEGARVVFARRGFVEVSADSKVRPIRYYAGLLNTSARPALLLTDVWTYAAETLKAEASHLRGAAKEALLQIIAWNALHGAQRSHKESGYQRFQGLCDTTHCSVFLGALVPRFADSEFVSKESLSYLTDLKRPEPWFMFSAGGAKPWHRMLPRHVVRARLGGAWDDVRRIREKSGEVMVQLHSSSAERLEPCEAVRNQLKLPTCPDRIAYDLQTHAYHFEGVGEGHGQGFDMDVSVKLAREGLSSKAILRRFFQ